MTKNCTALELNYCIKQCGIVFLIQMFVSYYFMKNFANFETFQPFLVK